MNIYYENNSLIFKIKGKVNKKIILYNQNYIAHIKKRHPEITVQIIEDILIDPDYIFRPGRKSNNIYYEKIYGHDTYRVVICTYKKHIKCVVTSYKVEGEYAFTTKHNYCIYDKLCTEKYNKKMEDMNNDIDYFYKIFTEKEEVLQNEDY